MFDKPWKHMCVIIYININYKKERYVQSNVKARCRLRLFFVYLRREKGSVKVIIATIYL